MDIQRERGKATAEEFIQCIERGLYYERTFRNMPAAREFYQKARSILEEQYGAGNKICDYMAQYDYVEELRKGNYREAILRLAKAGNLLHQFSAADVVDGITEWIDKNKEEQLDEVAEKTWKVYSYFDMPLSIEEGVLQVFCHMAI